jgi:Pyruvate phosphate dikinase, AMP/ATP-binding domain
MFKPHILDYAYNSIFLDHKSSSPNDPTTVNDSIKPPKMGVLIMQMVEAKKAGVCFTQNLWGDADEIMIEAVYGQGEGLVSGELTPDRYVLNKCSTDLVYQQLNKQTHKFIKAANIDGVEKVEITEQSNNPVLSARELRVRVRCLRSFVCNHDPSSNSDRCVFRPLLCWRARWRISIVVPRISSGRLTAMATFTFSKRVQSRQWGTRAPFRSFHLEKVSTRLTPHTFLAR